MSENKSNEGMPSIANGRGKKGSVVLILMGAILVASFIVYSSKTNHSKSAKVLEESFNIQSSSQSDNTKSDKLNSVYQSESQGARSEITEQQLKMLQEKKRELSERIQAPLMVVNGKADLERSSQSEDKAQGGSIPIGKQAAKSEHAYFIGALNSVVAQGGIIPAILETGINSDLPGFVRAIVSQAVYSEDGSQVLIPAGSRLVGEYRSGITQGQARVFIVWERLLTPAGVSLSLESPGVDRLGMTGLEANEIDRHFWERFGMTSLLSFIGIGADTINIRAKEEGGTLAKYKSSLAKNFMQSAKDSFQQDNTIAPTLKAYPGSPIVVFVAKDLHFEGVLKTIEPKVMIF